MSMLGSWPSPVGSARDDGSPVLIGMSTVSPSWPGSRRLPRWEGLLLPSLRATLPHRPQMSDTLHGLSHAPVDNTWPRMIVHTRQEGCVNARGLPLAP